MPCAGETVWLHLTDALRLAPAALVLGVSELQLPFKGGVLVPAPDLVVPGLLTSGTGKLDLSSAWPAGVPGGVSVWLQIWITDPVGPKGLAASNGVKLTTE